MNMDWLLQQVKDAVIKDDKTQYKQGDSGGLMSVIETLFGQHQTQQGTYDNPISSNQDPLGDPGDTEGVDVEALRRQFPGLQSSNADPLGDPGDTEDVEALRRQFPGLRSSKEDPLGDPG